MIPRATYRMQFHKDFRFEHAAALAGYLQSLGISHLYSSPILKARAGSPHGYDVVDHSLVNPELGGEEDFRAMAKALKRHSIGIVVDIVPNHMAVGKADNVWWLDVLENGSQSRYAAYFDIDWDAPGLNGKILAPFLTGTPADCLALGTLKLLRDTRLGKIAFAYFDDRFPLCPSDQHQLEKTHIARLSTEQVMRILSQQNFLLADWHQADLRINWRRFFDVTGLAALRMEYEPAFEAVHAKTFSLCAEGLIDGVRVDHIDGLADPRAYCRKLRARLSECRRGDEAPFIVVEKILAPDETLPPDWQIDGTTGYDFMNDVAGVLHSDESARALAQMWETIGARNGDFDREECAARQEILDRDFVAQRDACARAMCTALAEDGTVVRAAEVRDAVSAIATALRCYRTYCTGRPDSPAPGLYFDRAARSVRAWRPDLSPVVENIAIVMGSNVDRPVFIDAIRRFNQLTAPLAAKAVEDTAFYRYGRLLSRNEVGSDPGELGISVEAFHARISARATVHPNAMCTTATHDHKRGEDARARLAVLSEVPDLWASVTQRWLDQYCVPFRLDRGDVYQLLQTLLGAWPSPMCDGLQSEDFSGRIETWSRKFLREAKLRSSWTSPDESYEATFGALASRLIASAAFRREIAAFLSQIVPAAISNSIAQVVLRNTVTGVPDLFQGRERWDFSMVDPDNRAPVDYEEREKTVPSPLALPTGLEDWTDGSAKQQLIGLLLRARGAYARLFAAGSYEPLPVIGTRMGNLIAFARRCDNQWAIVVAARHCAEPLLAASRIAPQGEWWDDTTVDVPELARTWRNVLTGEAFAELPSLASDLLGALPAAVLIAP